MLQISCESGLKEWALTGTSLEQGRQIVLLRKGGLLDAEGRFELEQSQFWLCPTWLHQDVSLVKPEHRDLFALTRRQPWENARHILVRHYARVERVWALSGEEGEMAERLNQLRHVWSQNYLDLRMGYQAGQPLLCVALRVWRLHEPQRRDLPPEASGCRSWISFDPPLQGEVSPVLNSTDFERELAHLRAVLG